MALALRRMLPCCLQVGFCFLQLFLQGVVLCLFDVPKCFHIAADYAQASDNDKQQSTHRRTSTRGHALEVEPRQSDQRNHSCHHEIKGQVLGKLHMT